MRARITTTTTKEAQKYSWQLVLRKQSTFLHQTCIQATSSGQSLGCPLSMAHWTFCLSQRDCLIQGTASWSSLCSEYPAECLPCSMTQQVFVAVALKPELISLYLLAEFMLDKNQDSATGRFSCSTLFILKSLYNCLPLKTFPDWGWEICNISYPITLLESKTRN